MLVHPDARAGAPAVTEHRTYDVASRLRTRRRATTVIGGLAFDSMAYDFGDRLTEVPHSTATGGAETITLSYTGLGALAAQEMTRGSAVAIEQFTTDAAGNVLASRRRDTAAPLDTAWYGQDFGANGALLGRGYDSPPPSQWYVGRLYSDDTEQATGANGKALRIGQVQERIVSGGGNPPTPDWSRQSALRQYFAADGRLAVVQREVWLTGGVRDGSVETYGYDALGRRAWTQARRDSGICTATYCDSYEERATWDGDALLREVRSDSGASGPPYGTVTYLPGPALDAPLGLWDGRLYTPGWRGGTFESSVWTDGTAADAAAGPGSGAAVAWSAARTVYFQPGPGDGGGAPRYTFVGSLATGGVQTTGQLYRRNRFYDPQTGQFTQPDPIGLAGGLNLYGYAGGDPINFSDPFGLSAEESGSDNAVASDTTRSFSRGANVGRCAVASMSFSIMATLDVLTVVTGTQLVNATGRLAGATLAGGIAPMMGLSGAPAQRAVMEASHALVNTAAPAVARGYVKDLPVSGAVSVANNESLIGAFVPFSGTTDRVNRVATECQSVSDAFWGK